MGIGSSHLAFDEQGRLSSEKNRQMLGDAVAQLVTLCSDRANRVASAPLDRELHAQYGHLELHLRHPSAVDDFVMCTHNRQAE